MEVGPMKKLLCELTGKEPEDIKDISEDDAVRLIAHLSTKEARRAAHENTTEAR